MSVSSLVKHTRLRHALTLRSVQGRTLSGTVALYDINSKHFTPTHLYVGLSRATDGRTVRSPATKKDTNALSQMPDESLARLRVIWQAAGRPGQAKFRAAASRKGLNLSVKKAANFVRSQPIAQAFVPAPRSEGKVTSPELNEVAVRPH